jgi:hypothetical protein
MTLSHELQHFLQFTSDKQLWAIHVHLERLPGLPTHNLCHWFDLPIEIEARIVAKAVAEKLFGKAEVDKHIGEMIDARKSEEDAADWKFIRELDPDYSYDLRQHTIPLVKEYRSELEFLKERDLRMTRILAADNAENLCSETLADTQHFDREYPQKVHTIGSF